VKQADRDREANVADSAVGALGAVAGALPWVQYQQLLGQFLRLMKKHADVPAGKPVIRCAWVAHGGGGWVGVGGFTWDGDA
jgi:U3 small nucleolar RNA-associated protein 20